MGVIYLEQSAILRICSFLKEPTALSPWSDIREHPGIHNNCKSRQDFANDLNDKSLITSLSNECGLWAWLGCG